MGSQQSVSKDVIANDFRTSAQSKLGPEVLDAAVKTLQDTATKKHATGSIMSLIFYLQITVDCKDDDRHFVGNVGGISTPGGGALIGDIYSDDFEKLYNNTNVIQFTATPVYTCVIFFDSESHVLGHFQAGAISTVAGTGGGTGLWSQGKTTFPLRLDNQHGGTYIAHGKLAYDLNGARQTASNTASGGLSSTQQIPKGATNLEYVVTYTANSSKDEFHWSDITKDIHIEVRGVWPGHPSAKQV
jgi:hypothetical protein